VGFSADDFVGSGFASAMGTDSETPDGKHIDSNQTMAAGGIIQSDGKDSVLLIARVKILWL